MGHGDRSPVPYGIILWVFPRVWDMGYVRTIKPLRTQMEYHNSYPLSLTPEEYLIHLLYLKRINVKRGVHTYLEILLLLINKI